MSKRNLLVAGVVTGLITITGCSQQADEDKTVQSTGSDISEATDNVVVESGENLQQTADSVKPDTSIAVEPDLGLSEVVDEDQQY